MAAEGFSVGIHVFLKKNKILFSDAPAPHFFFERGRGGGGVFLAFRIELHPVLTCRVSEVLRYGTVAAAAAEVQ